MQSARFADKFICMIIKKLEGSISVLRRQHMLNAVQFALGSAAGTGSLSHHNAWAAPAKSNLPGNHVGQPEKRSITLATTNPAALPYLPLLVAQHKGFFTQQGLELQISEQQSAARAIAVVGSGGADIVCGWLENMLGAPGRALGLQSFVLLGMAPMMVLGVPAKPAAGNITRLAQLRGRKIGIVALNSPTHTVALAVLRKAGLRASDVGFVSVGSPASAQAALRSGQIDALVHMDPLMLQLEQSGEMTLLADLRSPYATYEALGMHLPSSCIAAPQEFLQFYPGTAQACSDALVQALQWLSQASLRDMLRFQEALPDHSLGSDAQGFVASFERLRTAYSPNGICSPQMASNLLQAMHEAEPAFRLEKIEALRSVNNALVQRSWSRLKL